MTSVTQQKIRICQVVVEAGATPIEIEDMSGAGKIGSASRLESPTTRLKMAGKTPIIRKH